MYVKVIQFESVATHMYMYLLCTHSVKTAWKFNRSSTANSKAGGDHALLFSAQANIRTYT